MSDKIKIISSKAMQHVLVALVAKYENAFGRKVELECVGGVDVAKRVKSGEAFDVVVLSASAIDELVEPGHIAPGSRVDLVTSGVAIAVKAGAPVPDLSDEDAVKAAILAAKSIGFSTGPSGVYLNKVFERWGIADTVKERIVLAPPGVPVGGFIAEGKVELGFQQLSELMHLPGIQVVGPLPGKLQLTTTFSAGIATTATHREAAESMLKYMKSRAGDDAKKANGMEPA